MREGRTHLVRGMYAEGGRGIMYLSIHVSRVCVVRRVGTCSGQTDYLWCCSKHLSVPTCSLTQLNLLA